MIFDTRKLISLVMIALFAGAIYFSQGLPSSAAFMPMLVSVPGLILCLFQFALDFKNTPKAAAKTVPEAKDATQKSEFTMIVWLVVFSATILLFGFLVGGPILVIIFVRFASGDSWRNAAFAGLGTYAVLFSIFTWLLELQLYQGYILERFL